MYMQLLEHLFVEFKRYGDSLVAEGVITRNDIEDCRSGKDTVISIGLPAYCILQALFRSAKANSDGLLLSEFSHELPSLLLLMA